MYPDTDIAIIGAGLAGTYCAYLLNQAGKSVTLIEKSRGTGGRASSKRLEDGNSVDLGAAFFHVTHKSLQPLLETLIYNGCLAPWPAAAKEGLPAYVGVPKMSAISRHLLGDIPLIDSCRVQHLEKQAIGWLLRDHNYQPILACRTLIITAPAAQTAALLASPHTPHDWLLEAHQASALCKPQWAMMITTPATVSMAQSPTMIITDNHPILDKIILDSAKPGRNTDTMRWVVQARRAWSERHLDEDKAQIGQYLLNAFTDITGLAGIAAEPHRWLLGQHSPLPGQAMRWNQDFHLGLAADWLCQGNIEGALLSAQALTHAILHHPS